MISKIMNILIGIDFILPFFILGMIQFIPKLIVLWLGVILIGLRALDVFIIDPRLNPLSQYQNSMRHVIVFYHHNRMQSFLFYLLIIILLVIIRVFWIN